MHNFVAGKTNHQRGQIMFLSRLNTYEMIKFPAVFSLSVQIAIRVLIPIIKD